MKSEAGFVSGMWWGCCTDWSLIILRAFHKPFEQASQQDGIKVEKNSKKNHTCPTHLYALGVPRDPASFVGTHSERPNVWLRGGVGWSGGVGRCVTVTHKRCASTKGEYD